MPEAMHEFVIANSPITEEPFGASDLFERRREARNDCVPGFHETDNGAKVPYNQGQT
jgi:hypothetical protein